LLNRKWKIRAVSFVFLVAAGFVLCKVVRSLLIVPKVIHRSKSVKTSEKNEFSDVIYSSFDKDSNKITLKSSKIQEKTKNSFDFNNLATTFYISPKESVTILADRTHFISQESKQAEMKGNVKLSTESGLLLKTEKSFVDIDQKMAKGDTDISIIQNGTKLSAKKYHFDMDRKIVTLIKNVKGNLSDGLIEADKLVIEFEKEIGKDFKNVHSFGNSSYKTNQYDLKANKDIIYKKEYAEANGNVELNFVSNGKNYLINTDKLTMSLRNDIIKKVTARNNLIIKVDNSLTIKGDQGILEDKLLTVSGNTLITNEKGNILCERAILNTKTNDIKIYNSKGIIKRD